MPKKVLVFLLLFLIGLFSGFFIYKYFYPNSYKKTVAGIENKLLPEKKKGEVIGFLPYWLIGKADKDYSKYLTTLSYFALSIDEDGTIQKFTNPGETEPGYLTLKNGKADSSVAGAREDGLNLSLVIFAGNDDVIASILEDPEGSAQNLINDVGPMMDDYGFSDLNLDIEQIKNASPSAKMKYTQFVKNVSETLKTQKDRTLSICVYASSFIKETNLVDIKNIEPLVDKFIVMAYDYHYVGSNVTGAVAPGEGGGIISEFDVITSINAGITMIPSEKLILGVPLYGYEWETIRDVPRSAVIPGTGMTISNRRAEELLTGCATCSAVFDETDKENYVIYKDTDTENYHQAFFPDKRSMEYKISLAQKYRLNGLALWALGYEGDSILEPLSAYRDLNSK